MFSKIIKVSLFVYKTSFRGCYKWALDVVLRRNNADKKKTVRLQKHFNETSEQYSMLRNEERTGHVIITLFCNSFVT
jgi:hypothetical protein